MKKFLFLICALLGLEGAMAQAPQWVYFCDKGPEASSLLQQPERLLSKQALVMRQRRGIAIDMRDVPVSASYRGMLAEGGVKLLASSRWLNAVAIQGCYTLEELQALCPAVRQIGDVHPYVATATDEPADMAQITEEIQQNEMLNVGPLKDKGYTGKGVRLAVCDGGFTNMNTLEPFAHIFKEGRLLAAWDFKDNNAEVYDYSSHGLQVLSTIGAIVPDKFEGIAPGCSFMVARTEVVQYERRIEEHNWVRAMEWADSLGVDIIHSSVGYSEFDEGEGNYTYEDLTGDKAVMTRAADLAASRGILINTSAGNAGNDPWHFITVPCDGDSVLCVGAVTAGGDYAPFSSVGPTADGRIKPDVTAMGLFSETVGTNGMVVRASGTSYSAPQVAGLAALLMEAHPDRSNMEVIQAIMQSGDRHDNPDNQFGHGIPNAEEASKILKQMDKDSKKAGKKAKRDFGILLDDDCIVLRQLEGDHMVTGIWLVNEDGRVHLSLPEVQGEKEWRICPDDDEDVEIFIRLEDGGVFSQEVSNK